jgi:hypothetical protein
VVRSANYGAPDYTIFSNLLSLPTSKYSAQHVFLIFPQSTIYSSLGILSEQLGVAVTLWTQYTTHNTQRKEKQLDNNTDP